MTFEQLRQKHQVLSYRGYRHSIVSGELQLSWDFQLHPDIAFSPTLRLPLPDSASLQNLDAHVFNLGMVELLSYWKLACPPIIRVEAGSLDEYQKDWWLTLLKKGLGEFFYVNQIDFRAPDLVTLEATATSSGKHQSTAVAQTFHGSLVMVGGGKDSIVSLETVKRVEPESQAFMLNPTQAALETASLAGYADPLIITRTIDPQLLALNSQGYLNGHTPFSAYLAFAGSLVASLYGKQHLIASNERSANEGNVTYLGQEINHQYSKSSQFEADFRQYASRYLDPRVSYYSLLRPLYELQIAQRFSQLPQYLASFKSCNRPGTSWCGACPKCLFTFTVLYPFVEETDLVALFQKNLFADMNLLQLVEASLDPDKEKPFECIGTREETLIAWYLASEKVGETTELPLLDHVRKHFLQHQENLDQRAKNVLASWLDSAFIPDAYLQGLKQGV